MCGAAGWVVLGGEVRVVRGGTGDDALRALGIGCMKQNLRNSNDSFCSKRKF